LHFRIAQAIALIGRYLRLPIYFVTDKLGSSFVYIFPLFGFDRPIEGVAE